jgi:hypothetical protein
MRAEEELPEPQERDGLDDWVDELDRLIGVQQMSDEEIDAAHAEEKKKKGPDVTLLIVVAIIILLIVAALLYFRIL